MDVSKLPAPSLGTNPSAAGTTQDQAARELAAIAQQDTLALAKTEPAVDHADIRPLDISAGMQILLAEIRAAFDFPGDSAAGAAEPPFDSPVPAARVIVELVLQTFPENAGDVPAWTAALSRMETSLPSGIQRAVDTVVAWRDVPAAVIDAVKQSATLALSVLGDEPLNPLWLRPEWVGLAPRLERFRRRRRATRRRLTDPDHWQGSLDDNDQR
jgi:hypothetical protein